MCIHSFVLPCLIRSIINISRHSNGSSSGRVVDVGSSCSISSCRCSCCRCSTNISIVVVIAVVVGIVVVVGSLADRGSTTARYSRRRIGNVSFLQLLFISLTSYLWGTSTQHLSFHSLNSSHYYFCFLSLSYNLLFSSPLFFTDNLFTFIFPQF